jgi:hypothetical protein
MQPSLESVLTLLERASDSFRELRESVLKAVRIAEVDPEMALTRTRKVLEFVVRDVYEKRLHEPAGTRPLENLLQRLVKEGHFPARLEAYASAVRLLGNVATHKFGETVGVLDVYLALIQMLPIFEWYLGIKGAPISWPSPSQTTAPSKDYPTSVYDNRSGDPTFQTWGLYSSVGGFRERLFLVADEAPPAHPGRVPRGGTTHVKSMAVALTIRAFGPEKVGVNKAFPHLHGEAVFEYQALESASSSLNLLFCAIPMQKDRLDGEALIEVGAQHCDEPENAFSPHRRRAFVQREYIGDGLWHHARIDFDFRSVPTAAYTILAPRVNEGCPRPAPGALLVRNVQLFSSAGRPKT